MPSVLSRLRGLLAPTTLDQPLRLADGTGGGGGASLLTTKGDLLSFDTAPNRVAIGANGYVPTADSTQAIGWKWAAPSGGGGGGGPANFGPDSHPATANAQDDEFESGSSIDLTKWTAIGPQAGDLVNSVANGSLFLTANTGSVNASGVYGQSITSPSSPWAIVVKIPVFSLQTAPCFAGIFVGDAVSGAGYFNGRYTGLSTNVLINPQSTWAGGNSSNVVNANAFSNAALNSRASYHVVSFDGTDLNFSVSEDGLLYFPLYTIAASSLIGGPPDTFGLYCGATGSTGPQVAFDFFRRTL